MKTFQNPAVAEKFKTYPADIREKLMTLRELIFDTAANTEGVGEIEETLKWGEPAYVTSKSKSGSAVRIDWKPAKPSQYAMYFHCQTNLVETFRRLFPNEFKFEKNRALIFERSEKIQPGPLSFCIAKALTYHKNK